VTPYPTVKYDPGGKTFWSVCMRHPCFVIQRRKVHQISRLLHFGIQMVNRLWEENPQPFRIVLLNPEHSIVAKAPSLEQIVLDFDHLVRIFGNSAQNVYGVAGYLLWISNTIRDILKFANGDKSFEARLECYENIENTNTDEKESDGNWLQPFDPFGDEKDSNSRPPKPRSKDPPEKIKKKIKNKKTKLISQPQQNQKNKRLAATWEQAWEAFLERAFHLCKYAMEIGILPQEDFEDYAPYLYLGVPSLTLLQNVLRSQGVAGFVVGDKKVIDEKKIPKDLRPLFTDLMQVKKNLKELKPTAEELIEMHKGALYAGEREFKLGVKDEKRKKLINKILAGLSSVSIRVSQQKFYLKRFNNVIMKLSEVEISTRKEEKPSWMGTIPGISSH